MKKKVVFIGIGLATIVCAIIIGITIANNKDNYEVDYSVFSMPPREVYREKQHPSEEILKGSKE